LPGAQAEDYRRNVEHNGRDGKKYTLPRDQEATGEPGGIALRPKAAAIFLRRVKHGKYHEVRTGAGNDCPFGLRRVARRSGPTAREALGRMRALSSRT